MAKNTVPTVSTVSPESLQPAPPAPVAPTRHDTPLPATPPSGEVPPYPPVIVNRMLTPARVWVRNVSAQPIRHAEGTAVPGERFQLHEHEVAAYGVHIVLV